MPDSDFWRDLAEDFRAIDPHLLLRADWRCSTMTGEQRPVVTEWQIGANDRPTRSVKYEFEALARRGGREIYPYMDSRDGWLETLRQYRLNIEDQTPVMIECDPEGTAVTYIYSGSIVDLRQASVDLCKLLESQALDMERMEEVRREVQAKAERQNVYDAELETANTENGGAAHNEDDLGQPATPQHHDPETRESRLRLFLADNKTSIAAVRRAAGVHKANMQQWRHGELSDSSVMSERIEDVLIGKRPLD